MKILVVDDSKTMRMIVKRTLRQAGYGDHDVVEAGNGVEALDSIKGACPDLVLCDWNMPEMNGLELLQTLNTEGIKTNFGFVTSEGTPEMRQVAEDNGALFLIAKPFNADTFKENFSSVLS
jgi:two-component system chemotaxis response regulator CheY